MRQVWVRLGALFGATMVLALHPSGAAAAEQNRGGDVARVVQLINAERQSAGLSALVLSPQLSEAAQSYSQVLASGTCFHHTCGGVPNFADRLGQAGYTGWSAIAENIAAGYPTPAAVMAGWMASSGHRANILSAEYNEIGVGVVSGGRYAKYWTQEFGRRRGVTLNTPPPAPDAIPADPLSSSEEP